MKKIIILSLVVFLIGCGKTTESENLNPDNGNKSTVSGNTSIEGLTSQLIKQDKEAQEDFPSEEAKMYSLIEDNNLNDCPSLQIEFLQKNCRNTILVNQAITANDAGLCAKIEDEFVKQSCLSLVSAD